MSNAFLSKIHSLLPQEFRTLSVGIYHGQWSENTGIGRGEMNMIKSLFSVKSLSRLWQGM